jgi:hypothetical protein
MKKRWIIIGGLYLYLEFMATILPVLMMMAGVSLPPVMDQWISTNWLGTSIGLFIVPTLMLLVIGAVFAAVSVKRSSVSARESVSLLKTQMIVRLIQIPGYVICFALALLFLMTIFTAGFSLFLLLLGSASILITGLFSIPVYTALYKNGQISRGRAIVYSALAFVFCADVVVSVFCYRQVKDLKNGGSPLQEISDTAS